MKAIHLLHYFIPDYGEIHFVPNKNDEQHEVLWKSLGSDAFKTIGEHWPAIMSISGKAAIWWVRVGCALDDEKPRHYYADGGIAPPVRIP